MDRIDMHVEVPHVPRHIMQSSDGDMGHGSDVVRQRVETARKRQLARHGKCNAQLDSRELREVSNLSNRDMVLLDQAIDQFGLSSRASHRILKVARTIADLAGSIEIQTPHLTEAINYRKFDRMAAPVI